MRGGFDPGISGLVAADMAARQYRAGSCARGLELSGKVDFRFSEENATTQRNLERVSAQIESP